MACPVVNSAESSARVSYDGAKQRKESKVHALTDTLSHLSVPHVTAADKQDRAQVETLAEVVQQNTGRHLKLASVEQELYQLGCSRGYAETRHALRSRQIRASQARFRAVAAAGWSMVILAGSHASEQS